MSTIAKQAVQAVAELKAGYTLGHADVAILNELARIALASLEAKSRKLFTCSGCGAEGLDEPLESKCHCNEDGAHWIESVVYTAPPAPVSVPDEATPDNIQMLASTYAPRGVTYQWDDDECNAAADSWNACRAAMLLGSEPDFREISNSSTNNFRENAETSTKCWCHTCRPVKISDMRFVVCPDCGNKRCPHANDHRNACTGSNEPGQEGSAYPAAPQQEVTQALAKGMERYGDAMQELAQREVKP
ncbi:hypothetical protein [Enterobacter cloacae]|uniref:hypothetical protein n=1 Tax=Enterobacter cloacae TaxID=550 RepID=UPI002147F211|nr:hypothetical protein [Enterobacter cloacae]